MDLNSAIAGLKAAAWIILALGILSAAYLCTIGSISPAGAFNALGFAIGAAIGVAAFSVWALFLTIALLAERLSAD